jgi:LysM repeat protein
MPLVAPRPICEMSEEPEVVLPSEEPRYCPVCGARVAELATSCLMCGASFEPDDGDTEELLPDWAKGLVVVLLGVAILAGGAFGLYTLLSSASEPPDVNPPTWTPTVTLTPVPSNTPTTSPTATPIPPLAHPVQSGETVSTIADAYGTTVEAILAANPGLAPEFLQVGQVLKIPVATSTPNPTATYDPDAPTPTPRDFVVHVVEVGDTLLSIAEEYGVSISLIRAANDLTPGEDTLFPRQSLMIPLGTPVPTATPTVDPQATPTPVPLFAAPPLLYPADGAEFCNEETAIVLQWASMGVLADDEWYSVELSSTADSVFSGTLRTHATSWRLEDDYLQDAGCSEFTWSVVVVRESLDYKGDTVYVEAGYPSQPRTFTWLPVESATGTPSG